jgi:hypothetical protein
VETFASPLRDQKADRALFRRAGPHHLQCLNNERFSHKGKFYTLPPEVPYRGYTLKELTLVLGPFNLPVECWQPIQSGSMRALEFTNLTTAISNFAAYRFAFLRHTGGFEGSPLRRSLMRKKRPG